MKTLPEIVRGELIKEIAEVQNACDGAAADVFRPRRASRIFV
jgi:hypothetical protein